MREFGHHRAKACTLLALIISGGVLAACGDAADEASLPGMIAALQGHTESLYAVAFSPEGRLVATASFDKTIKLWEAATGKEVRTFAGPTGHQNLVLCVAFSPDGNMLASGSQDNTAKVWDVPSSRPMREYFAADGVRAIALSPDGSKLAGAGKDLTIKICRLGDGKPVQSLAGDSSPVTSLAYGAKLVVAGGADGSLHFWDPASSQPLGTVFAHSGPVSGISLNPNNAVAYSAGKDDMLKFWQLPLMPSRILTTHLGEVAAIATSQDGALVASAGTDKSVHVMNGQQVRPLQAPSAPVTALAISPAFVAVGGADSCVYLWNAADGKLLDTRIAHVGEVTSVAFHPQSTQMATAGKDGMIKIWAMPPALTRGLNHPAAVLAATLTADGQRLVTGAADDVVRIWTLTNGVVERQLRGHAGSVTAVAAGSSGQSLASGSADGTVRLWDSATGKEVAVIGAHAGPVNSISINPDATQLVTSSSDGTVKLWRPIPAPSKPLFHPERPTTLAPSADGAHLLTGCLDQQVRLWNVGAGQVERTFAAKSQPIAAVAYSPSGAQVAAAAADKSITIWSTLHGKEVKRISDLPASVRSLAFIQVTNPAAPRLAVALADNFIRVFDLARGKERVLTGHKAPIIAVAGTMQGDRLISASEDGAVWIWSIADGKPKTKLDHGSSITCMALSADCKEVATASRDHSVKVWTVPDGKLIATFTTPAEALGVAISLDGHRLAVAGADQRTRIYDRRGSLLEFFIHDGPVYAALLQSDGKRLITAGSDNKVRLWTSALAWRAPMQAAVCQAEFNQKGDHVFTADANGLLRILKASDGKQVKLIAAHDGPIAGMCLNADGNTLLSAGADKKLKLWAVSTAKPAPQDHDKPLSIIPLDGAPESLTLSSDGKRVAVAVAGNSGRRVRVLNLQSGSELVAIDEHTQAVHSLTFLSDNRTLVSAGEDKIARVHDIRVQEAWQAHPGGIVGVAFNSSGSAILSGGADKMVRLWTLLPGKQPLLARTFGPVAAPIRAVAFSRNSALVGAAAGHEVNIWSASDGKHVTTLKHIAAVTSLSFSADQTRLVAGCSDGLAKVWDLTTGQELESFRSAGPAGTVAFSKSNAIISGGPNKTVVLNTIAAIRTMPAATSGNRALAMTPSGSHLLTANGKTAYVWNTASGSKEPHSFTADGPVRAIAVSRDGQMVALAGEKTLWLFQFADAKQIAHWEVAARINALSFNANSQVLAAACEDKMLRMWSVPYNPALPLPPDFGKPMQSYEQGAALADVGFVAEGNRVYSVAKDGKVFLWKLSSAAPVKNFAHPNLVDAVAFGPSGAVLATGCHDGTMRVWDVEKGQPLRHINAHTTPAPAAVYCMAWSPDGKQVVSGSFDHSLKLWDATTSALIREFKGFKEKSFEKGHKDGVFCVAFSPDGKLLASGSSDHTIKLWRVADATVIGEFVNPRLQSQPGTASGPVAHPGWVYGLRFSPDGKYLISAGNAPRNRGYLALWNVPDCTLAAARELATGPIYGLTLSPDGARLALACGPQNREQQNGNGYVLKTGELTKR
jgi:WD40 repeat protein